MAKNKIQRIDQEIAKVREKIAEYQDKLKTLEAQKTEAENLEIVQMVRALRLTPEQFRQRAQAMKQGLALPSEDDVCTTRYLQQLMEGVGIIVLDHVIVAGNQTYSMAQHGELLHPSEMMRAMVAAAEKPLRK